MLIQPSFYANQNMPTNTGATSSNIRHSQIQEQQEQPQQSSDSISLSSSKEPEYVEGELLVKFKGAAPKKMLFKSGVGAEIIKKFDIPSTSRDGKDGELCHLKLTGVSVKDALSIVQNNSNIEYAEPNYIIRVPEDQMVRDSGATAELPENTKGTVPNDLKNELWGLKNEGQTGGTPGVDINAEMAWNITTGSKTAGPLIAVIDTGVDINHQDLINNIYTNPGEIPNNGIDDDGNGYIDDVHGYNFNGHNADPMDNHSHGTHCAGTIGAEGNNGIGITGVNWDAQILPIKFMDRSGGSTADAIEAVIYATKMGAKVCSNSWGGGGYSQALHDAIAAYPGLFIAAAGNEHANNDIGPHYPSNYDLPNVISVASTDKNDNLSTFSNYGKETVDIAAPGTQIYSTIPYNQYQMKSGTSMATPHVSGVAALIMTKYPELSAAEVKECILKGGDDVEALKDKVVTGKRLNAYNSLQLAEEMAQKHRVQNN